MNKIVMCFAMAFALFGMFASVSAIELTFQKQASKELFMNKNTNGFIHNDRGMNKGSVSVVPARDPTAGYVNLGVEGKPKGFIHTTADNKLIFEMQPKPNDYRKLMVMTPKSNSDFIHIDVSTTKQTTNYRKMIIGG